MCIFQLKLFKILIKRQKVLKNIFSREFCCWIFLSPSFKILPWRNVLPRDHCLAPRFILPWMSPAHRPCFSQNGLHRADCSLIRQGHWHLHSPMLGLCCQFNELISLPPLLPSPRTKAEHGAGIPAQWDVTKWSCPTSAPGQGCPGTAALYLLRFVAAANLSPLLSTHGLEHDRTYLPTINLIVFVQTPFRARAKETATKENEQTEQ